MNYDLIRIDLEAGLSQELYELFEGNIIEKIIRDAKVESEKNPFKSSLEGHSFKITERMAPSFYALCQDVLKKLQFEEETDFFIVNSPEVNCYAISRLEDDQSHIVMINSEMIERFDDDELRFVVGHEIGHLISKNSALYKIINFVFPDLSRVPLIFQNKIALWDKLAELTADRYGFIASPKLDKCITNFYKLASGLDLARIDFDPQGYFEEMEQVLDYFKKEPFAAVTSHPINPLRIKAIKLFHDSKLYQQIVNNDQLETDENLRQQINELLQILFVIGRTELDTYRGYFIATGGLIIAGIDQDFARREIERIVDLLSQITIFPKKFLDNIVQSKKVEERFHQSVQVLLEKNPGERFPMFEYLINIALSDNDIVKAEIDVLYEIGEKVFGFTHKEIAQIIASQIQHNFYPKLFL